jgi:hypothetical protein
MKRTTRILLTALAVATLGAAVASADPPAPGAERRHTRQHERIVRGVRSGQLTRQELRQLRRGQARLRRTELRMKADRRVREHERARLHRRLDRESRHIWRLKHNGRCYVL